jgi:hypothetical protein
VEWAGTHDLSFQNPGWTGNAYDVLATATFTHATEPSVTTELYFNGGDEWVARFRGSALGAWSYYYGSRLAKLALDEATRPRIDLESRVGSVPRTVLVGRSAFDRSLLSVPHGVLGWALVPEAGVESPAVVGHLDEVEDRGPELVARAPRLLGRLELVRTQELLDQVLPAAPAVIGDIGGATGAYDGRSGGKG